MPRRSWRDDEPQDVSPPPLKRKKLSEAPTEQPSEADVVSSDITIYSWNINGIAPFVQEEITNFFIPKVENQAQTRLAPVNESLKDVLRRYQWPTMLLLQEVKIKATDLSTQRAIQRSLRTRRADAEGDEPPYIAHFCLPSDPHNARGFGRRVYGVCSIIREDFFEKEVARVRKVDWDAEGRFCICETKGSPAVPRLAIINVYALNGTDSPYKDSRTGEIIGTRHDRKLEVHRKLQEECRMLEEQGFAVVLAGDMNVARSALDGHPNLRTVPRQHCLNRADFEAKFFGGAEGADRSTDVGEEATTLAKEGHPLGMIDTFRTLHPTRKGYTYYPRGVVFGSSCDRVDMILISKSIENCLKGADIKETRRDRGTSDHVPLSVMLRFKETLKNSND